MADKTAIEWTDATWNPVLGCTRISEGCGGPNHQGGCYAEKIAARFSAPGQPFHGFAERTPHGGRWTGKLALVENALTLPLRWRRPRRIFVNSMSDLFHENLPDEAIDKVFAVMALAPQHTFQVLTKRAERMRNYMTAQGRKRTIAERVMCISELMAAKHGAAGRIKLDHFSACFAGNGPFPNVWLGVSVENQKAADERIPDLLATPAAKRFLSCEPLLGPLRLDRIEEHTDTFSDCGGHPDPHWPSDTHDATWLDALRGGYDAEARSPAGARRGAIDVGLRHEGGKLDWIICGGESGPNARPMHPDWARSLRDQCQAAGVPFFFKQWGEWVSSHALPIEIVGTREQACVLPDGRVREWQPGYPDARLTDPQMHPMTRVGKKAAGAMLDGREWREFPS